MDGDHEKGVDIKMSPEPLKGKALYGIWADGAFTKSDVRSAVDWAFGQILQLTVPKEGRKKPFINTRQGCAFRDILVTAFQDVTEDFLKERRDIAKKLRGKNGTDNTNE